MLRPGCGLPALGVMEDGVETKSGWVKGARGVPGVDLPLNTGWVIGVRGVATVVAVLGFVGDIVILKCIPEEAGTDTSTVYSSSIVDCEEGTAVIGAE
jgi:hypothetical protein